MEVWHDVCAVFGRKWRGLKYCNGCGAPLKPRSEGRPLPASYSQLENGLSAALEQQSATSEILRAIGSARTDPQPVFDAIVQNAVRLCHATTAAVFLTDGRMVYHPANYGSSPEALAAARARYPRPLAMDSTPGIAILTRSPVHTPDIEEPSAPELVQQIGRQLGIRSVVTLPMLCSGDAVGAIVVARREPGRFSDREIELLRTFADQAVIAVENVRLFTELRHNNQALTESLDQQTATSEILRVISSSPTDVRPVLDAVAEAAARLCSAKDAVIRRVDGDMLRLWVHHGDIPVPQRDVPLTAGLAIGRAVLERRTIHVDDVAEVQPNDEHVALRAFLQRAVRARTVLATPLVRDGVAIGVILIRRMEVRPFSAKQVELLQTFADAFAKCDYGLHVGHFLVDCSGVVRWTWIESPS